MKRCLVLVFAASAALTGLAWAQTGGRPAILVVKVPADATVVIGTSTTTQRGVERRFVTAPLDPGFKYTYDVEATWKVDGKDVKSSRVVEVTPGQTTTVDFLAVNPAEKAKAMPTKVDPKADKKSEPKTDNKPAPAKEPKKVDKADPKPAQPDTKGVAKIRTFLFTYGATVKDLKPGQTAKIWLPVPEDSEEQMIAIEKKDLPGKDQIAKEGQYGNSILFVEGKANEKGEIPLSVTYKVMRKEVKTDVKANLVLKPLEPETKIARFLQPDAKVPITGKPLDLIKDKKLAGDQFAAAKVLYDVVNAHMKYSKVGEGWGNGDSVWACDSKFGNCSDFHSLFISMARGNKIPAKFEMGFPIPTKHGADSIGGYHCWAWFLPDGKGWVPVDISEANRNPDLKEYYFGNLTEDRVQFTTGRDIDLTPRQEGPALNFFIYPYVEVDGKALPKEKVQNAFSYQDI